MMLRRLHPSSGFSVPNDVRISTVGGSVSRLTIAAWSIVALIASVARADPQASPTALVALVPGPDIRDARLAVAIGPVGEI